MEKTAVVTKEGGLSLVKVYDGNAAPWYFAMDPNGDAYSVRICESFRQPGSRFADVRYEANVIDATIRRAEAIPAGEPQIAVRVARRPDTDRLVLVNRVNPLPENWDETIDLVFQTNSLGDTVEAEREAYKAYLGLKKALLDEDGVRVYLDSAYRSVEAQQEILDRFTEIYGADYAAKIVARPGYSEHHTGLALDLYLNIDGEDVYLNEDMMQYPEIWAKIHEKLADYGFILRYPEGMEHVTGYAYEPWHIRYVGSPETARAIRDSGLTLEGWLGAVRETKVDVDYGASDLFTLEERTEAAIQVKCHFAARKGCELHTLAYAGDEQSSADNLAWVNEIADPAEKFVDVIEFVAGFRSPAEDSGTLEPDTEYENYQFWLARTENDGWEIVSFGY